MDEVADGRDVLDAADRRVLTDADHTHPPPRSGQLAWRARNLTIDELGDEPE